MILINDLIKKLQEIQEYYPDIPVDVDSINIHVSIGKDKVPVVLTLTKQE